MSRKNGKDIKVAHGTYKSKIIHYQLKAILIKEKAIGTFQTVPIALFKILPKKYLVYIIL